MLQELEKIIRLSWNSETSYSEYDIYNPSCGQCAVTALIVNDFMGGLIMRCVVASESHYFNIVNKKIIDLTVDQFKGIIPNYDDSTIRTREYLLSNEDTKKRYCILLNNVKNNFIKYGTKNYVLTSKNGQYFSKIPGVLGGNSKLKIYGKLDCYNALYWINKGYYVNNRVFFENEDKAKEAGYRPCAKCMRKEYKKWKDENGK